jgi:transposase
VSRNRSSASYPNGLCAFDFGECFGVIGGVRMKLHVFCFDLPHSGACFIKAYPAETTEAFLDGRISAFGPVEPTRRNSAGLLVFAAVPRA